MMDVGEASAREALADTREETALSDELFAYAEALVRGVQIEWRPVEDLVRKYLIGWDYGRLAVVDRTLLRMATYELLFEKDIPPAVSIDEAIELAKKYSTAESGKFVNGVLGNLLMETPKANWVAPERAEVEAPAEKEPEPSLEEVTPEEAEQAKIGFWKLKGT